MVKHSLLSAVLAGLLPSAAGVAQDYFTQSSGSWEASSNWSTNSVPTSSVNAYIGGTGGHTATLSTSGRAAANLYLGTSASSPGVPGSSDEGPGTLSTTGSAALSVGTGIYVGYQSTGTITVSGGTLTSNTGPCYIGATSLGYKTVTGTVNVSGSTSTWTGTGDAVYVGDYGPGYLYITSGGTASTGGITNIGNQTYSSGTVIVDGPGSNWATGQLDVGNAGTGSMTISNGATVTTSFTTTPEYIGGGASTSSNGIGTVTVTGASSKWTLSLGSSENLLVGDYGPGYLYITSGGNLNFTKGGLLVGGDNGSNGSAAAGTLTIDGAGSTLTGVTSFTVGYQGPGTLNITNGATESFATVNLGGGGNNATASGTATIGGAGTQLTLSKPFYVGNYGTGTLSVTTGGTLTVTNGCYIGSTHNSATGTVTVDGSGTQLAISGLYVGNVGNGTLHITNGAIVANAAGSTLVGSGAGTGMLDFGASNGGTLNTQSLYAAPSQLTGAGTVNATGLVTDGTLNFNPSTGLTQAFSWTNSSGTVAVNLNLSTPANNGALGVGYVGNGSLNISGEAVASSTGVLGYKSGSSGTAIVSGSSAGWTIASGGTMTVGNSGTGALYVCGGGAVTAPSVAIGSTSLLEIDAGYGSSLNVGSGTGTLTDNGTVRVVAGAGPAAGSYSPISATWAGSGAVQPVGGTWNSGTFTVSAPIAGTSASATTIADLSGSQRMLITDSASGTSLGASFLAAQASDGTTVTLTASTLSQASLSGPILGAGQSLLSGWALTESGSGPEYLSSNPAYLSLSTGFIYAGTGELWSNSGSGWTRVTPPDLTYDNTNDWVSFGTTNASLNGYDYAVSGTKVLAGDANLDGRVDINDLTIVLTDYNQSVGMSWSTGDFIGDGTVDINDLTIVLTNYNTSVASGLAGGISAVPEPGTLLLLAAGLAGLLTLVWRRK